MRSNDTGKYLFNMLNNDLKINQTIGDKNIFPIIAEYGVKNLPFIAYQRNSSTPTYTKDGLAFESVSIEILCIDSDYDSSNELALMVRDVLDNHSTNEIRFKLVSTSESWVEEGRFIQTLVYDIDVK